MGTLSPRRMSYCLIQRPAGNTVTNHEREKAFREWNQFLAFEPALIIRVP